MSDDEDERKQLLERRRIYQRNLILLENQRATYTDLNVPPHIVSQITDIKADIAQIDRQLKLLNPALDNLRTQALVAFTIAEVDDFRGDLTHVANLLNQIVKVDPNDEASHEQLAVIRRHQQWQRDYAAIGQVRNAGRWKAVELLLTKLAQRMPDFPDPKGHWEWVKQHKALQPAPQQTEPVTKNVSPSLDQYPPNVRYHLSILQNLDPTISFNERLSVAEALGNIGDPRRGVCDLEIDWCNVPAGTYVVGSDAKDAQADDDEKPMQKTTLSAFKISKYCVTNAQWWLFMVAGGYRERRWWGNYWHICQEGWDWNYEEMEYQSTNKQWIQPRYWKDEQFNAPNQPVVGVSWYEAMAFCTWLSEQLGYRVTLPTEAQWEVAARGPQRTIYPWSNHWHVSYANTNETGLKRTTPVGCYPHGASWCGTLDMSGNVWEWTSSDYNNAARINRIDIVKNSTSVSIRGGSWVYDPQFARSAYRFGGSPQLRYVNLGIRCLCEG